MLFLLCKQFPKGETRSYVGLKARIARTEKLVDNIFSSFNFSSVSGGSDLLGPGHRSRQGSKRRRKKDNNNQRPGQTKLKLTVPTPNTEQEKTISSTTSKNISSPRSASYSSLNTCSVQNIESRSFRACLSSSPCPGASKHDETTSELKSPTIIFTGSSTLPRAVSESRRHEAGGGVAADSVLTLQLEGALGCSMSVSESGSREDTLSPLITQKTGNSETWRKKYLSCVVVDGVC